MGVNAGLSPSRFFENRKIQWPGPFEYGKQDGMAGQIL